MKKLESLVPPLDLCRQIPPGAFDDSALVWERNIGLDRTEYDPVINTRKNALCHHVICPAPTLAEIMAELPPKSGPVARSENDGTWTVIYWDKLHDFRANDANPAAAALQLWLSLNAPK